MFTKLKVPVFMLIGSLMAAGVAQADGVKVGFVNISRLISESPQGTTAMEQLQEEFAPRQREVIALQTEMQEKQEQIKRDLEVMGPEERRNAERDLRRYERELARSQQEFQEDINLRRNEALGKLQRDLLREVQGFAASQGYDLVVSDGVLYASTAIDITEQVLTGLKASFTKSSSKN